MSEFAATCAMMAATCKIFTATRAILALTWFCHLSISLWSLGGWEFSIFFFNPSQVIVKGLAKNIWSSLKYTWPGTWCCGVSVTWGRETCPSKALLSSSQQTLKIPASWSKQSKAKQSKARWDEEADVGWPSGDWIDLCRSQLNLNTRGVFKIFKTILIFM